MEMQEALDRCEFAIRHQQEEIARLRAVVERQDDVVDPTESNLHTEIRSSGPKADPIQTLDPNSKINRIVALASEAIRYVNQKKRSEG
jgi:hypothetical protein